MQDEVLLRVILTVCLRFLIVQFLVIGYNNHCSFKWEIVCLHSPAIALLASANPKALVYLGSITSLCWDRNPRFNEYRTLESCETRA